MIEHELLIAIKQQCGCHIHYKARQWQILVLASHIEDQRSIKQTTGDTSVTVCQLAIQHKVSWDFARAFHV